MITLIKLKNWKSHLDSKLTFSKGVNALIGIMGSGKTSVMQAIAFALFGTFSGLSSRKLALDDLIMSKPQTKEEASVEIEFVLNGKKYSVERTIKRGKGTTTAEIRENGKLLEVNPKGVTKEVERILQMDHDLFQRAVYSEQNALDYFLQIPKGKRMQQIDSMLKLDRYDKAREAAVKIKNNIANLRQQRLSDIESMKERRFEEKIRQIKEDLEKKEKEKDRIENECRGFGRKIESMESEWNKKESEVNRMREKVAELNERIRSLEKENKEIMERLEEKERIKEEIKNLEKMLGGKEEELLKNKEMEIENKRKEFYSLKTLKSELAKSLEELEEAGERCPVCESPITKEKKRNLVEHKTKHIEEIERKLETISKNISKGEKGLAELRERIETLREKKSEIKGMEDERKRMEKNEREIKTARKEVEKLVGLIREKEGGLKDTHKELKKIVAKERELKTRLESLKERIEEKKVMLEEMEKDREVFLKYVKEAETYGRIIEAMDSFVSVIRLTQNQLRDEFLKTVNYIMNHVWNELYPYGDFSDIRMLVDKDYVLQLKGTKGWVNVDTVSGGERSLACLALRIAFSLAFTPNLRWLILDEPTHNLDRNAIEHFGRVLRDRMENLIDQVFLITHEERLSDYITGSMYKLERDKEMDGVTKVIVS